MLICITWHTPILRFHIWRLGLIAKLLIQVLVTICAAGKLLAGNCAKGNDRDKAGIQA